LPCQSTAEYRALLGALAQHSDAAATSSLSGLLEGLPGQCEVTISGHAFHLSTAELKSNLRGLLGESDGERRRLRQRSFQADVQRRLQALEDYQQSVDPTAKTKLQEVFQRREFRRVGGQDPAAVLKEWLSQLLLRVLSQIFKNPVHAELAAKILAWSVCLLAVALVLWKLYRWLRRARPASAPREVVPFVSSAKSRREWLSDAQAAAGRGELRAAVHAGYWAVLAQLQSSKGWRMHRARTPREHLQLLEPADPARPLLAEITRQFEVAWYGNRTPSTQEWESFLAHMEQIGCR
jgi:hypothetical protein